METTIKKPTHKQLLAMEAYLNTNPEVTLPSGRVITACELALVRVFQNQTSDEKRDVDVKYDNNRGFQHVDAKWGTMIAQVILGGGRAYDWQMHKVTRLAIKYRRQLVALANAKARAPLQDK